MNRKQIVALLLSVLLLVSAFGAALAEDAAKTVVYAASVYAEGQTDAQALAIDENGKLIYIGSREGAAAYVGADTEVVDAGEASVFPGFIDGHTHLYIYVENQASDVLMTGMVKAEDYVAAITNAVNANPGKDYYSGFGWVDNAFIGGSPTAAMLDKIAPGARMYFMSEDCHSCWVNTAMMEVCGITDDMTDPDGGVIVRDENGKPNGCFRDTAMDLLIKPFLPVPTVEEYMDLLLKAQDNYFSLGYTAYNDVIIDPNKTETICQAYAALDAQGLLKAKVTVSCLVNNNEQIMDNIREIKGFADKYSGNNFRITDVKFFMDGIVESETAFLSEPYVGTDYYGSDRWASDESMQRLCEAVTLCNDLGLNAHFHAIGDAAVTKALDAVAYAREHSANTNVRNCMTHIQLLRDEDVARFAALDVYAVCDLGWGASMNEELGAQNIEELNVGTVRNQSMYRYHDLLDAGANVSFATDFPAGPISHPLLCMQIGMTRQYVGIESTTRNQAQAYSNTESLDAISIGGARQLGIADVTGSLAVGKDADFVIVSRNLATIDAADFFPGADVLSTYVAGEKVAENTVSTMDQILEALDDAAK